MSPVRTNMHHTYILQSQTDKKLYTGCTANLRARFDLHQRNKVASTKGRGPFKLLYYEACTNKDDAYAREKYLKSGMGKRFIKNRIKRALVLTG
jgi:putative endonuclease